MTTENQALQLMGYVIEKSLQGVGPLASANDLASEYIADRSFRSDSQRVDSLINWEASKNFTSGFLTGLGGLLTLPVNVPVALGSCWVIQARMAASIAIIYGHDIGEDRIRTMVLMSLVGDSIKEIAKTAGIRIGNKLTEQVLRQIPGRVLIEINKKVGFRLITKAGEKGCINLLKMVPIAGGLIGGAMDASSCVAVGKTAYSLFAR